MPADIRRGQTVDTLDTPALLLDLDRMMANVQTMVDVCRSAKINWRPHAKCHKSSRIARWLVDAGAIGVTCAKVGEAEIMAAGGVVDLLIANLIVGPAKLKRLVRLAQNADPIVVVDHFDQVRALAQAFEQAATERPLRVLVEVDIGMQRVGLPAGPAVVELAERISDLPPIKFSGVMGYEGHLLTIEDRQEKRSQIERAIGQLTHTAQLLDQAGLPCDIVSCGGTGSYEFAAQAHGITEIQAGGAIFMDAFYRHACHVPTLDFALTAVATVVGRPTSTRVIIDAGRKTLNGEIYMPRVLDGDTLTVDSLSAEHGILRTTDPNGPNIGDRIMLLPGYADLTVNLHNQLIGHRKGVVEDIIAVEARGVLT